VNRTVTIVLVVVVVLFLLAGLATLLIQAG
jgi:hypothetical protein